MTLYMIFKIGLLSKNLKSFFKMAKKFKLYRTRRYKVKVNEYLTLSHELF